MPRKARKKAASGVYHVMVRGIDKADILRDKACSCGCSCN